MNKKKMLIGAGSLAGVAVLTAGGISVAFASGSSSSDHHDRPLTGNTLQQASTAAITAAGGGTVTESERSDDAKSAYEVEVTTANGTIVDVDLDKNFLVVKKETEAKDDSDKPLTGATLTQASAAAITAAGGGTVTDSELSDDSLSAYEVEVTTANGTVVDVHMDKSFAVVKKETETKN